jgi:hypothetical protein
MNRARYVSLVKRCWKVGRPKRLPSMIDLVVVDQAETALVVIDKVVDILVDEEAIVEAEDIGRIALKEIEQ